MELPPRLEGCHKHTDPVEGISQTLAKIYGDPLRSGISVAQDLVKQEAWHIFNALSRLTLVNFDYLSFPRKHLFHPAFQSVSMDPCGLIVVF